MSDRPRQKAAHKSSLHRACITAHVHGRRNERCSTSSASGRSGAFNLFNSILAGITVFLGGFAFANG